MSQWAIWNQLPKGPCHFSNVSLPSSQMWWLTPVIPAFGKLRTQDFHEFQAILGYNLRLHFKQTQGLFEFFKSHWILFSFLPFPLNYLFIYFKAGSHCIVLAVLKLLRRAACPQTPENFRLLSSKCWDWQHVSLCPTRGSSFMNQVCSNEWISLGWVGARLCSLFSL